MELMEDGTTIEQQMFAMATEKKVPLYGVLELLPLCNLNCDMCYVRMSREEMEQVGRLRTIEEWTKTAEDMMKAGTLFVLLTGGEPLLYPHFRELYQKLRELGMIITINTNGTLIDEAWADFFAENKPRRINITLYGASNETYERLCHYPGGFDKAVNGIRLLRERNIDVKVNGSLAKANVDDRMKIIELGESLDAPVRIDTYMYPSVRERNHAYNNQARLDPEMAAKARVEVLQREMGEEVFAQYRKIRLDEAENTPEGEAVPGQMACRAGKSSFVVNWQGEMRSCVVLDKPSISLRDVEFEEAWELTKKGTESLRISARCSSCKLRKVCNTCVAAAIAPGKRTITYVVFDKANQAGTLERTVQYEDYTPPKIHLTAPLRYSTTELSKANLTENMTAEDCLDGDLTSQIRTSMDDSMYNTSAGVYKVTVQVSNSAGDVCSVPLEITVTESGDRQEQMKEYPVLSDYIAYTTVGHEIDPMSYVKGMEMNGATYTYTDDGEALAGTREAISVKSEVDYSKAGVYPVEYSYMAEGAPTAVTKLFVVVQDQEGAQDGE